MSDEGRGTDGRDQDGDPLAVLSVNVGSSSLKAAFRDPHPGCASP
jgi:hypothetical protein